jgi:hypothetical protein
LQALAMLNDPLVLEASRVLAADLVSRHAGPGEAIKEAFARIICREPEKEESGILMDYYREELERFERRPEEIAKAVNIGEHPLGDESKKAETAALMQVIVAIYNVEEAITKT